MNKQWLLNVVAASFIACSTCLQAGMVTVHGGDSGNSAWYQPDGNFVAQPFLVRASANVEIIAVDNASMAAVMAASNKGNIIWGGTTEGGVKECFSFADNQVTPVGDCGDWGQFFQTSPQDAR